MIRIRALLLYASLLTIAVSMSAHSGWWPFSKSNDGAVTAEGGLEEVNWDDLVPDDFEQPENPYMSMSQEEIDKLLDGSEESKAKIARLEKEFNYAPVVPELDGKRVKIPAYITPLEFDGGSLIKEFLLVPYVGACIHVPPPPSNQIVHAQSPEAIKLPGMREPVWAIGTIRTETVISNLAESGYRLEVEKVIPYERE